MKTIYMTQKQWRDYTLDKELGQAVGGAGRIAGPRHGDGGPGLSAGEDKVIDLAAWKAENLAEADAAPPESGLGQYEGRELVRRRRRKYAAAQARAELAATLAVAGVLAALILRILVF